MIKGVLIFLLGMLIGAKYCHAQNNVQGAIQYLNQYGQPVGTAVTNGNQTIYSNQWGQVIGYADQNPGMMTTAPAPLPGVIPVQSVFQPLPMLISK